jgi:hypothetical protein
MIGSNYSKFNVGCPDALEAPGRFFESIELSSLRTTGLSMDVPSLYTHLIVPRTNLRFPLTTMRTTSHKPFPCSVKARTNLATRALTRLRDLFGVYVKEQKDEKNSFTK